MFYFFVRVGVNLLALWLTFMLLPGLTLDVDPENELTPENITIQIGENSVTPEAADPSAAPPAPTAAAADAAMTPTATPQTSSVIITGATSADAPTATVSRNQGWPGSVYCPGA